MLPDFDAPAYLHQPANRPAKWRSSWLHLVSLPFAVQADAHAGGRDGVAPGHALDELHSLSLAPIGATKATPGALGGPRPPGISLGLGRGALMITWPDPIGSGGQASGNSVSSAS